MKINREHFLAAAMMIGAVHAMGCKAKIGDEATQEGNQAEAPANESGIGPASDVKKPINLKPPVASPAKEGGALASPTAEAGGWGGPPPPPPPPATVSPAATSGWGAPTPTAAAVATTKASAGWTQPKPPPPPPPTAAANKAGWTQPKK